jgi:hypothetical protein
MNNFVNTIANSLLSKDQKNCSLEELQQLTEAYPYSGGLQLLYAQKLKEQNSNHYELQWQKTMLYFNNPLFLQQIANTPDILFATNEKPITKNVVEPKEKSFIKSIEQQFLSSAEIKKAAPITEDTTNTKTIVSEQKEKTVDENTEQETVSIPGLKIETIDPEKTALSFTPYHTIDYFASQGIRLRDDVNVNDRFGNQLKSFTSWLKEMRRLPEAEIVSRFSQIEQSKVEKMAENSLTGENAITEAMAEVWIKQGDPLKAIEIYQKLSLQNFTKSAFFAAKIEHLKKQL